MVGPLALVVLFSFGSNTLIGFPMGGLTLSWYGKLAADEAFRDAARISLVVATSASVLSTMAPMFSIPTKKASVPAMLLQLRRKPATGFWTRYSKPR